ncbi:hypothetical protein PspCFBP13506_18315 [Pseudomonas sp. CFBP13506]|nr:hypothetical protein PspCFBP13506_18315 [Pseudomonas sp. CFBP13506]
MVSFAFRPGITCISLLGWATLVPCGAMKNFLRRSVAPSHVTLKRLPSCVAAKQNGFWQIVR